MAITNGTTKNRRRRRSTDMYSRRFRVGPSVDRVSSMVASAFMLVVSVRPMLEQRIWRHQQNPKIQGQRPVVDVLDVARDPRLHLRERLGVAAMTANLRETRDSRLDPMPAHVMGNLGGVAIVVHHRVW